MSKKYLCTLNPLSGTHKAEKMLTALRKDFPEDVFIVLESKSAGYFSRFIDQTILTEIDAVLVLGGDGTMHDVVNALHINNRLDIPVLLFPAGSGNAFNHDFDSLTYAKASARLRQFRTMPIDLMKIEMDNHSYISFNMIGWGLINDISRFSEELRWMGPPRYTIAALIQMMSNPSAMLKVELDDMKYNEEFSFILILNTKHTGKGMKMAPMADLQDGLLDVLLVRKTALSNLLKLFPKIYSGKHINSKYLEYRQVKTIHVESEFNQALTIDGEIKGSVPFKVSVLPEKLVVIA
jgi:YegS/Rv2252/BmrU family lipid kinase